MQAKRDSSGVPSNIPPVVIVPSLLGSKLQAQLDGLKSAYLLSLSSSEWMGTHPIVVHHGGRARIRYWYCWSEWKDWFTVWVSYTELSPFMFDCWCEQLQLHFDDRTGRSFNTSGSSSSFIPHDEEEVGIHRSARFLLQESTFVLPIMGVLMP